MLQASGIKVIPVDMSVIIAAAQKVDASEAEYTDKAKAVTVYAEMNPSPEQLDKLVKYSVAVERFVRDNGLDATAVQCWDSLQCNFGYGSCLTQSMMSNSFNPSACEGDEPDICVSTHCGNYPADFIGVKPRVGVMGVLSTTIGAVKGMVRPGV